MAVPNESLTCNLCDRPGRFDEAAEQQSVPCNVRAFLEDRFTVWRCPNCRSLHCREAADLGYYYGGYFLGNQKLDYFTWCVLRNRLSMFRRRGLQKTDSVLDYGCGANGLFVEFLRARGYDAHGYDPFAEKFSDPGVLSRKFNVVASFDVIEHDDDPRDFFTRQVDLLAPGGLLFVGTPRADGIDLSKPLTASLHQPYHRHILSEKALLELGQAAGLDLVDLHHRWVADTPFPVVNNRFIMEYIASSGHVINSVTDPPKVGMVLASPRLMFFAIFGYLFPPPDAMGAFFRKPAAETIPLAIPVAQVASG